MNVNNVAALSGVTTELQNSPAQTNNSSAEKNLFMTLLVAQLKNQDPLAPQDSTQFVAQLAQFNSLDQLMEIRQLLEEMRNGNSGGAGTGSSGGGISASDEANGFAETDANISKRGMSIIRQGEDVLRQSGNVLKKGESVINKLLKVL